MNPIDKLRLYLLAAVAAVLRIPLTYTIKFLPMTRKRTDFRGRAIANPDSVGEAIASFSDIEHNPSARKEKTDGIYYLEIEGREGIVNHFPGDAALAKQGPGGVHEGLPGTPETGPAPAAGAQAAAAEAEGAAGGGDDGGYAAGAEAAAESGGPVGEVSSLPPRPQGPGPHGPQGPLPQPGPLGPPDERAMQESIAHASLDQLGER